MYTTDVFIYVKTLIKGKKITLYTFIHNILKFTHIFKNLQDTLLFYLILKIMLLSFGKNNSKSFLVWMVELHHVFYYIGRDYGFSLLTFCLEVF